MDGYTQAEQELVRDAARASVAEAPPVPKETRTRVKRILKKKILNTESVHEPAA